MKAILTLIMTGLILLAVLAGCDNRTLNIPTNPTQVSSEDADRVLAFSYESSISGKDYYRIALYGATGNQKDNSDSVVEVAIGDSLIPLHYHAYIPFFIGWISDDAHLITGEPSIRLKINNNVVLNTKIKAVNKASVAFPGSYDYQQSLNLNWAVTPGNQYQFVRAESWPLNEEGSNSPYSRYVRQLAANTRSHRFPSNCVTPAGSLENTLFALIVQQVNYKIVSKTAVMVYHEEGSGYQGSRTRGIIDITRDAALEIHEQLTGR